MPTVVSFLVYGLETEVGRKVSKYCREDRGTFYDPIDVRKWMRRDFKDSVKRRYKVKHNEDGDALGTQIAILDDNQFSRPVRRSCCL